MLKPTKSMGIEQKQANRGFLQVVVLGSFWLIISLLAIRRHVGQLLDYIYTLCQANWDKLSAQLPNEFDLLIALALILILTRGLFLLFRRLQATRRFRRALTAHQIPLSPRLSQLAGQVGLSSTDLACIDTPATGAFSLGGWRPKVWVSTGLVQLLRDDELLAVLHHEAHHCRQQDPLRLLISRIISDSFFFIPILRSLADQHHLTQEMAADAAAIERMGDLLPLASALHKLLAVPQPTFSAADMAVSQLNVTERRIMALVEPGQAQRGRPSWPAWFISICLAMLLISAVFISDPSTQPSHPTCDIDYHSTLPLDLSGLSEALVY
jgi:Zn-dependent protease with chaperone function